MLAASSTDRARRASASLLASVLILAAGGCTSTPVPVTADRLNTALEAGPQAFSALFSSPTLGAGWYSVLVGASGRFSPADGSGVVTVSTRFPGDARPAHEELYLSFDAAGRITGTDDNGPRPLWALTPVVVSAAGQGTLISSGLDAEARAAWAQRLVRAATAVAASGLVATTPGLVVELPADEAGFSAVSGADAGNTAAITSCDSGTSRIVVNPAAAARGEAWLQATVVHEAVHAATESACHHGTAWVVEGSAESVAEATDPATAKTNRDLVRAYLKANPIPEALPEHPTTPTDYALAAVAVEALRSGLGTQATPTILRGITGSLTEAETSAATEWYRTALRKLR